MTSIVVHYILGAICAFCCGLFGQAGIWPVAAPFAWFAAWNLVECILAGRQKGDEG